MIKGYIFGFLYIMLVATSTIWLNNLGKNISIPTLLFYASIISILIFNLANLKYLKRNYAAILESKKNWVCMSASLVLIWYFTYYSTIHSSAEFFIATAFLTTALTTSLIGKKRFKALSCMVSLGLIYLYSQNSSPLTMLTSMVAGVAGYIYYKTSFQFSQKTNINALAILSIRFYFVLLFATAYSLNAGAYETLRISLDDAFILVIFSLINMVIPAFFSQNSLHAIGVSRFTFLNTLVPALTFILEAFFRGTWQTGALFACLCATIALNFDHLESLFIHRKNKIIQAE